MFDIGAQELLLTAVVAIVVIGPKDLPRALRMAGGWIAKIRRVSNHFRSGVEEMIRQAELEELEKKWREKNEAIMNEEVAAGVTAAPASAEAALGDYREPATEPSDPLAADMHPMLAQQSEFEASEFEASEFKAPGHEPASEPVSPELPLAPPVAKP